MPVVDRRTGELPVPRLPRLGIIRLGYKADSKGGGQHPVAANNFVLNSEDGCQPIIDALEDEKPTSLSIIFPGEDEEVIASHYLRSYNHTHGLVCMGDGLTAKRKTPTPDKDGTFVTGQGGIPICANSEYKKSVPTTVPCRCPRADTGECKETMYLRFIMPDVPGLGVWQLVTGSKNGIANIQGMLVLLRSIYGRISHIPLKLELRQQTLAVDGVGPTSKMILFLSLDSTKTPRELAAAAGNLPAIMPVIDAPDDELDTGPEDGGSEGDAIPAEVEEADHMSPAAIEAAQADASPSNIEDQARAAGHKVVDAAPAESKDDGPPALTDEQLAAQSSNSEISGDSGKPGLSEEQQETLRTAQTKPLTVVQQRKLDQVKALCEKLGVVSTAVVEYIANTFTPKDGVPPKIWELKGPQTKMLLAWLNLEFGAPVSQETESPEAPAAEAQSQEATSQASAAATIAEADQAIAEKASEGQQGLGF